ncbi:MAG: prolipoprotein diacylglyceryl transferase family protein [Pseudomonadota bacterium]
MIPFIHIEPFIIGPMVVSPFGVLLGLAIIAGYELSRWRGDRLGLDPSELHYFIMAILIGGLAGAHVFDALFYYPREVMARPLLLLEMWNGISSFGGFAGAVIGGLIWKYFERRPAAVGGILQRIRPVRRARPALILPYADVAFSVFPIAFFFGRMGCAIDHDHPGILAPIGSWLAVAFGPGPARHLGFIELRYGTLPRYDLGLLEMLFSALLALTFMLMWRSKRVCGWYIAVSCILYAPVRFLLDFLRSDDPQVGDLRYAGLTPAQWASFALFACGIVMAIRIYTTGRGANAAPCRPRLKTKR